VRTAAILPVKRFAHAKQRLGASITEPLRARLAAAMVSDVLAAAGRSALIERTIVVTAERSVAREASSHGALVLDDSAQSGQSQAVGIGVAHALAEGYERVLCIPGDCPALEPAELDRLLDAPAVAPEVVIVPDRHGTGTNGLLLTPPGVIAASFGPGSCERHLALARAAGVSSRLEQVPSLLLDVDTGEDLAVLRTRLAGSSESAARTRAVLGSGERHPILSTSTSA